MAFKEEDFTRGLDDVVVRKSVHSYVNEDDAREVKNVTKEFNAEPEQSKDAPVIRGAGIWADRDVREAHTDAGRVPKFTDENETVASNLGSIDREPPESDQDKPVEDHTADNVAPADNTEDEASEEAESAPEGTVSEVKAWVGDDKERAQLALDAENARSKPRTTLIEDLNNVLDGE